jgi:hypothetical protein
MAGGSLNPISALRGQSITQGGLIIIVPLTADVPNPTLPKNQIDALVLGVDHCAGSGRGGNGNPQVA